MCTYLWVSIVHRYQLEPVWDGIGRQEQRELLDASIIHEGA